MISVIVPVYNVEPYLRYCLDSIMSQTYRDLEIILVDDGSTDGSGHICDEYSKKDNRFVVIHQENKGLSGARNSGLAYAHGKFISFIDSDDYVEHNMLEELLKLINTDNYSIATVFYRKVYNNTTSPVDYSLPSLKEIPTVVLNRDEMIKGLFNFLPDYHDTFFQVVWNKLYRRDILDGLCFGNSEAEDIEFNHSVYLRTDRMIVGKVCMYNWFQRMSSVTHLPINEKQIARIDAHYRMYIACPTVKNDYKAYCLDKLYKVIFQTRYKARGTAFYPLVDCKSDFIKNRTWKEYLRNGTLPLYRRLGMLLLYHSPCAYNIFRSLSNHYSNA